MSRMQDDIAHARGSDPQTSHDAADKVDVQHRESDVIIALVMHGPMNAKEIAAKAGLERDSVTPRLKPLERKGIIELTGDRRDGQQVWRAKRKIL